MKLLFDQNLSHKLVAAKMVDFYPGSAHVREFAMQRADDDAVWAFAAAEGYLLVTKDEDFQARSLLLGDPPKVLWIRSGNCATDLVETLLRKNRAEIEEFERQEGVGFMPLQ